MGTKLKIFGFSKNITLDEMSEENFQALKRRNNNKFGVTAVVFPNIISSTDTSNTVTNDGNIDLRDGNTILADGNTL